MQDSIKFCHWKQVEFSYHHEGEHCLKYRHMFKDLECNSIAGDSLDSTLLSALGWSVGSK